MAERSFSTKATRAPKTVAGYRSILDTIVLPRWRDVPLRDVRYDDLQVWIASLSVDGSDRFEGKGLSASRVRQTHQLVGAVLKFAVKAKHLPANPAEGVELPRIAETERRYLTHEQLHRVAVASGRLRTLVLVLGSCGLRFGEAAALRVADVDVTARRFGCGSNQLSYRPRCTALDTSARPQRLNKRFFVFAACFSAFRRCFSALLSVRVP